MTHKTEGKTNGQEEQLQKQTHQPNIHKQRKKKAQELEQEDIHY